MAVGLLLCFPLAHTHISSTYKVHFFTFMKYLYFSLHISNIHNHFKDIDVLVTAGSLLLIACDIGDLGVKVYSSLDLIRRRFLTE